MVGLDVCPANIAYCSSKTRLPEASYLVADAENIPFANESFDVVLNMESAHAYPNRAKFYAEVYRILRPGGIFLYTELMPADQVEQNVRLLRGSRLVRNSKSGCDLECPLSCEENAKQRTGPQGIANKPMRT